MSGHSSRSRRFVLGGVTYRASWVPFAWQVYVWDWQGVEVRWALIGSAATLREARRLMAEHSFRAVAS